jgi:primosomal protein N' (replication factor Y)
MRAHFEKCVILLGSATPSCESRHNADIGKYTLHTLTQRATNAKLPQIRIVDMGQALDKQGGFSHFSDTLLSNIKERISLGEQTLLLLNKRGYHRMQLCKDCRWVAKCPHCDLSLTFHKQAMQLKCHMCHFVQMPVRICPTCKGSHAIEFKGFGTEHVEKSLYAILPDVRILRMDRDTTQTKNSHEDLFQQFRSHKADVLIGTQMIAKGFHFPSVTLVGVLNLDASLSIPDFRSPEHVFQLLIQVAGRAGRSNLPGEVIIQTFLPEHPVIAFAKGQDFDPFYQSMIAERKEFDYPPFSHFVKIKFSDSDESKALQMAETTRELLRAQLGPPIEILPVSPAGHAKTRDLYHFQFLIKTPKISLVSGALTKLPTKNMKIDVDPISTFF